LVRHPLGREALIKDAALHQLAQEVQSAPLALRERPGLRIARW
jgi:hypothetical protein